MGRMLIQIPRFYSKDEFKNISASIPEDYEENSEEYWNHNPIFGNIISFLYAQN